MPVTNKLTALSASKLKQPGRYADGGNLYLQISPSGGKSWLFRYMLAGRSREMGLGPFDIITLAEARDAARKCRKLLFEHIDPIEHRKKQQMAAGLADAVAVCFEQCALDYIADHRAGWKNAKHADQWEATFKKWAFPLIGSLPVSGITTDLVLKVLKQPVETEEGSVSFWNARTETASRVRGRVETVLDWAKARKLRPEGENPARWKGNLDMLLPAKSQVAPVEGHPALPYKQMPAFMAELRERDGLGAQALQFTIFTAARTNETINAVWSEIDLAEKVWTVPAARMKGKRGARKRDHVVPLSDEAVAILAGLPRTSKYVFPAEGSDNPLSTAAMAAVIKRINDDREAASQPRWVDPQRNGADVVPHGFRSSFKDWAGEETEYPNELSEMALSHTLPDKVEAAYRRGDMRERRRRMMQHWAAHAVGASLRQFENVIPLRA